MCKRILVLLMLSSCSSIQPLPVDWVIPVGMTGSDCPDISGRYLNIGESARPTKYPPRLFDSLFTYDDVNRNPTPLARISRVVIEQPDPLSIQLSAWASEELIYRKSLSRASGDFLCKDGWLIVESISYGEHARTSMRNGYARSDGLLLERLEAEGVSLAFLFPIPFSSVMWLRFTAVAEPEQ